MMTCERCGKEIPDNIAICPNCGTVTSTVFNKPQPPTKYGPYSGGYVDTPPAYPYTAPPMYQQTNLNVTMLNTNNSTPIIVELLLSIFLGIYGVGWLLAGETAVGVILLVCSFVFYLPLFILSVFIAFFTF